MFFLTVSAFSFLCHPVPAYSFGFSFFLCFIVLVQVLLIVHLALACFEYSMHAFSGISWMGHYQEIIADLRLRTSRRLDPPRFLGFQEEEEGDLLQRLCSPNLTLMIAMSYNKVSPVRGPIPGQLAWVRRVL